MKVEGDCTFDGPRWDVWEVVRDPEVLANCLPGTQKLEMVGENEYEGEIFVRIGPVAGEFAGRLVVSAEVPPESCTLGIDGKGKAGFANGTINVQLIESGAMQTLLKYDGEIQIGGRLAGVGQRMIDTVMKSMIRQGTLVLNEAVKARVTAKPEEKEVEYTPPTEAQFAAAVAKDVAGGFFSSKAFMWTSLVVLIGIIGLVVLMLIR